MANPCGRAGPVAISWLKSSLKFLSRSKPVPIASPGVGADQEPARSRIASSAEHPPPAPDALHGEFRRVVAHPDVHKRFVEGDIVGAVGDRLSAPKLGEVMHMDLRGLSLPLPAPTRVFEGSHEFLL